MWYSSWPRALGCHPSRLVPHSLSCRSWHIWGRPDLTVTAHLDVPNVYTFTINHNAWYCGVSLSQCMCRTLISRMHMTVNRMWLSIAKPQATEYDLYFVYSTHTCTTQELSQASSSSPTGTSHTAYMTAIHWSSTPWHGLGRICASGMEESSLAVLVPTVAIEEVGLWDKWPLLRKYRHPYTNIHRNLCSFAATPITPIPLAIVQVGLGVLCPCCRHQDEGDCSWFMSFTLKE